MQKLKGATTLIDQSARSSEAVVAQGGELLEAATLLLEQASGAMARAADELGSEAASLRGLKTDVDSALDRHAQQSREHAELTRSAVEKMLQQQHRDQREVSGRVQQTLEETDGRFQARADEILQGVRHLAKAQHDLASEVKNGFEAAARSLADQAERLQGVVVRASEEARQRLEQDLVERVEMAEAKMLEQGRLNARRLSAQQNELEDVSQRAMWGLVALAVLQVAILVAVLWPLI